MKKISIVFVLLIGFVFTQTTVAATLVWSTVTVNGSIGTPTITNVDPQNITGSFEFNQTTATSYTDTWKYSLTGDALVENFALEFFDADLIVTSVFLDAIPLVDTVALGLRKWEYTGNLLSGFHIITLNINKVINASGEYDLKVSTIPVPAAIWLFGSAIAGLVGMSRRKTALAA